MSYEQLTASVDALKEANDALTETVLSTQGGAIDARDASEAFAIESLTSANQSQMFAMQSKQAALVSGNAAQVKVDELRSDLSSDQGADFLFHKSPLSGAVKMSAGKKWDEVMSLEAFGAIGDKTYHPLSERFSSVAQAQLQYVGVPITALTQSIDWAATYAASLSGASEVFCPGVYVLTDSIPINRSMKWFGAGYQNDVSGSVWALTSSTFIAYGTFTKQYTALGVTDGRNNGGVFFNNPSKRFDKDASYSLANYYTETADPKLFSACFYIGYGISGVIFEDLMILKNFNGVDGYASKTNGWGDDIDVGVYIDNARYCTFRNVNVVGYWKLNGLLIRSGCLDTETTAHGGIYSGAEENKFYNCVFQGWKSVGLRSIDMYKCLAVTSTYVEIPYTASHPFKNHMRMRSQEISGIFCALSSIEQVGDRLRLYTVGSMVGKYFVGDPLLPAYHGNGVAGSVFHHCRMHGMWHTSGYSTSDTWHSEPMEPSACVEISGSRIRGQRFEGTKFQTTDDIAVHAHQTIDLMLTPNARFEGTTDARGLGGVRMLSTNIAFEYYCRETYRVQIQTEQGVADFRPYTSVVSSKFAQETPGNFWNPTLYGVYAEHGIYIGDRNDNNKLKSFYQGSYTVTMSTSDSDYSPTGVVREGNLTRMGDTVTLVFSYYSGTGTFTTGNGQLQTTLPAASTHAVTMYFPMAVIGNAPAAGKSVFLQLNAGESIGRFVYWGASGNVLPLLVKDATTSGAPLRVSGSFTYRSKI